MPSSQNVSMTAPTDYNTDALAIERRRRLAEALQTQSQQPLDVNQTAGGWAIPVSPYAGLAKALNQGTAAYAMKKADREEKDLAAKYQTDVSGDTSRLITAIKGTPASVRPVGAASDIAPDYGSPEAPQVNIPAQSPTDALQAALPGMKTPQGQQLAQAYLLSNLKNDEKFGHTPVYEKGPDGTTHAYVLGDKGTKRDLGPADPRDKFSQQTADSKASLAQAQQHWDGLSENQKRQLAMEAARLNVSVQQLILERANAANKGISTQFDTGTGVIPGMPTLPQIPSLSPTPATPPFNAAPSAPGAHVQQPQAAAPVAAPAMAPRPAAVPQAPAAPSAPSVLPPKLAAQVEAKKQEQRNEMEQKREFNMGGLNPALDEAERILKGEGPVIAGIQTAQPKPTSSLVGSAVDTAAGWVGASPRGAAQADQLRAIGGALVSKMPRMEGPQSDKDVAMYREMAGRIGDDSIPISRRLAALTTVRELYAKYEKPKASNVRVVDW